VLIAIALVVQLLFERVHVPGLVGLLAAGMLIGPDGYGVLPEGTVIELLGDIGLLYIMFLAGLEMDLRVVKQHKRESAAMGLLTFALPMVIVLVSGVALGFSWSGALLLGAALSSHTLVAYPMLEKMRLLSRRPVVATVGGTLLTDTLALVLLVVIVRRAEDEAAGVLGWTGPILLLAVLVAVSLLALPRLSRVYIEKVATEQAHGALFALVVLMLLSAAAKLIETEEILGAFLAGVCLNSVIQHRPVLSEHIQFVGRMLFIPFFFIATGMRLDLQVFTESAGAWSLAAVLFAGVVVGKGAAAWIAGRVFSYTRMWRTMVFGLTIPQAAATLAVVVIGYEADLFDALTVDAVIIVIFLTCTAGPLIARFTGNKVLSVDFAGRELPDEGREEPA
jgi:Kef-type K+ transport system membrane component KefB